MCSSEASINSLVKSNTVISCNSVSKASSNNNNDRKLINTVEPPYKGHLGTRHLVLYKLVSCSFFGGSNILVLHKAVLYMEDFSIVSFFTVSSSEEMFHWTLSNA